MNENETLVKGLEELLRKKKVPLKEKISKPLKLKRRYITTTEAEKTCIVLLRFGSLQDLSVFKHSFDDIAKLLSINRETCRQVVKRYQQRGHFTDMKIASCKAHRTKQVPIAV